MLKVVGGCTFLTSFFFFFFFFFFFLIIIIIIIIDTSTKITAKKNNKQDLGIPKLNLRMKIHDDNVSEDASQKIRDMDTKNQEGHQ